MQFDLSADQVALRDAARSVLDDRSQTTVARGAMERGGTHDADLWRAMVDQGWCGIAVTEAAGGVGLGWVEAVLLLEEVGAHVSPAPILGQIVALDFLAGSNELADLVEGLLSGERIAAVVADPSEPCPYRPVADLVVSVVGGRLVAARVEPREPVAAMDLTRPIGWFDPADAELIDLGGADAVTRFRDVGSIAYSAELLGLSQRVLDLSVGYAKERVQFGKPIGSFQAVKHRCADMLVDVEGMRSALWWAAWCASAGHLDASVAASTAKAWCSDASDRVMSSAMQVHGGIGFTWEHDLHLYLKRAHLDSGQFGDARWHRSRLAGLLKARIEAGGSVI